MADATLGGASQDEESAANPFVSAAHHPDKCDQNHDVNKEKIEDWDPGSNTLCSSAKQYRKMHADDVSFSYTWEQTNSDVAVTVRFRGLSDKQTRAFDVSFTSTEVNISISDEKFHVIRFYDAIQKDKSRVQLKKGSITLLVVKQQTALWPTLEAQNGKDETAQSNAIEPDGSIEDGFGIKEEIDGGCAVDDQEMSGAAAAAGSDEAKEELNVEIIEKEEEPVYLLDHLKHDFFERGYVLTLQVYTKSRDKDAVKIAFSKNGFVLKFHTGDAKFLQRHEGTTSETTFTWPVTTRQEIVPDECKFKIKSNTIEIILQKTTTERWISLEAPLRKETADHSKSDTWMPVNKATSTVTSTTTLASTSSASSSTPIATTSVADLASSSNKSSSIMFDDLSDIDLNDRGYSAKKPTAKVHPLNNQTSETGIVVPPGFAGLVNLGNTCFMNCVLQVLANTKEFRDYFLDGRFQHEINTENPLGMRGQLAATFGVLLRWLWSCKKHCWEPRKLKDLISKKNPQFFGYAQHDAHEFLAFLLDGLHEDLNRIREKPYTETIDSDGRPDEVVAAEAWAQYKQRNDSVVVDLFQGQYKSKLVCPRCGKVSITFDPFLYLSVPLPKKKKIIPVTFFRKESYKKPVRFQISVTQDSTVEKLKEELSNRTQVRSCDIRVFEALRGRIIKFFFSGASLANVDPKDHIIACEVLSEDLAGEEVLEIPVMQRTLHPCDYPSRCAFCHKTSLEGTPPLKRCTKCYKAGYCDHTCQKNHWNLHKSQCSTSPDPIGCPFIISLPRSRATYAYLVKHMEGFSRFSVDIFQPPVKSTEGRAKHSVPAPASNLNSSLSQSCSSLNSLDSLSSASSTCTLTGDQSDPQTLEGGDESAEASTSNVNDNEVVSSSSANVSLLPPTSPQTPSGSESLTFGDSSDSLLPSSGDSGFESIGSKSLDKAVPKSQVMGIQATEAERDKATPTFFIKPVSMEGTGIKGAERLEDKGDQPLELINRRFLSMDWRNNERQPFYVLVQSKELEAEEVDNLNNMAASGSNKPSLEQCLELFTEPEVLSPEEAWYCPSCKQHVEASKQMAIWRLPHTLIIQLKRFSFQNFLMRSKIKKHVEFPTRGLDMTDYCVGLKPGDPPPIYDLYGVANHHGLLIGGHYTSYVRCCTDAVSGADEVGWRLCDDSRVSPVANEKSVVTSDAYLLFYRQRGCQPVIGTTCNVTSSTASTSQDVEMQKPTVTPYVDSGLIFSGVDDEKNGNIIQSSHNSNMKIKESVNNKLLRDLNRGEASDRCSNESMNLQNISRDKDIPHVEDSPALISQYQNESAKAGEIEQELEEEMEKGDKEKDFVDCDMQKGTVNAFNDDGYDDDADEEDDDREERNLVIDTQPDLGYTDMEAVD